MGSATNLLRQAPFLLTAGQLLISYAALLGATAWSSGWTLEMLQNGVYWHFLLTRMIISIAMFGVLAACAPPIPSAALAAVLIVLLGAISKIKREATGEPLELSDLLLADHGIDLLGYMTWYAWLAAAALPICAVLYIRSLRFRVWTPVLFLGGVLVLVSYRLDPVAGFIAGNGARFGLRDIVWNQAANERTNGLPTHLYFSSASVKLGDFTRESMAAALAELDGATIPRPGPARSLDVYVVLGEAWWSSPADPSPPLSRLRAAGFFEGTAVSPVYGGLTPNVELEVLTAVPMSSFGRAVVPYQHYVGYFSDDVRTLPRLFIENGYTARAFHNHKRSFWLRDRIFPKFGFESFDDIETMAVDVPRRGWPPDVLLYSKVLSRWDEERHRFSFLATVATHGPFRRTVSCNIPHAFGYCDFRKRLDASVTALLDFEHELRRQARPFVIVAFGDHLPGLPDHQQAIGMQPEDRHRVPIFISTSDGDGGALRDALDGRPLYCLGPLLIDWMRLRSNDRYLSYVAQRCTRAVDPALRVAAPVIHHQLFAPLAAQTSVSGNEHTEQSRETKATAE